MKTKDAFKLEMEAQLKEWSAQIGLMEARIENSGAVMQNKPAVESMKIVDAGSVATWGQAKESADKIWDDLKAGFSAAH